jgi:hypothetical protein
MTRVALGESGVPSVVIAESPESLQTLSARASSTAGRVSDGAKVSIKS